MFFKKLFQPREDAERGVEQCLFHLLDRPLVGLCQLGDNEGDVGRFVALSAIRMRGEIGRIGLDDYAIERHSGAEHGGKFGLLEGKYSAYAEHEAGEGAKQLCSLVSRATKAVEHASEFVPEW